MDDFPAFMKDPSNRVPVGQQHTEGVEGYVFEGPGTGQVAFWSCMEPRDSDWHAHDFDEYLVVVAGEYVIVLDDSEQTLHAGDEAVIPRGTRQAARVAAGTRTIHAFGGQRIVRS